MKIKNDNTKDSFCYETCFFFIEYHQQFTNMYTIYISWHSSQISMFQGCDQIDNKAMLLKRTW